MVCSEPDVREHCSKAPRVAIHYPLDLNVPFGNYASRNVHSLFIFNASENELNLDCYKLRRLRMFSFNNIESPSVKLQSFEEAPHLRYLRLNVDIKGKESEFEEWIRGMKYLDTLDLRFSLVHLSDRVWQAKTRLRQVLASTMVTRNRIVEGPPASIDLKNLQTLIGVRRNSQWGTSSFPNIPNVRDFEIYLPEKVSSGEVASLTGRLKHVVHLKIGGNEVATATGSCLFNENLKSLCVFNYNNNRRDDATLPMPLVLRDDMLPAHLVELQIIHCEFGSDFMPVLEKLGSLKTLFLWGARFSEENENRVRRIKCSAGGFEQLEKVHLLKLPLEEWEIEPGAMPMLRLLEVWFCDPLRVPPELTNHLSSLKSLSWKTDIQANKDALDNIFEQRPNLRPR